MNSLTYACKAFDELSTRELYEILHLRDLVFVVGQKITSEPEVDGLDPDFEHVLGRLETGVLVATARLSSGTRPIRVGRIAVHPDHQHRGIGTSLMEEIHRHLGNRPAQIHAQAHLEDWYSRLGWKTRGSVFLEAEIPHLTMWRESD